MEHLDSAKHVVHIAANKLGARPGDVIRRSAVERVLGERADPAAALSVAESRGWIRSLSSHYLELTRIGYARARLSSRQENDRGGSGPLFH